MKRFFAMLGRFFWSWGFLKFILSMIALIIFFYVEEDWRGARAWAATQVEWEAKGETFDPQALVPPPVPDDQNLAAIPLFKLEPVTGFSFPQDAALKRATRSGLPSEELPWADFWHQDKLPDMAKIRNAIANQYAVVFKGTTPPGDSLAQFNALYPFTADLLAAAATHPLCRFNFDYTISPPYARPLSPLTGQIRVSQLLTLQAVLALDQHQPDLALKDIETNYKLLPGAKSVPGLIGGLVAIGMTTITQEAICDGLVLHAWNDAQLAELEQALEPVNYLADYQFAMRSEAVNGVANFDFIQKRMRLSDFFRLPQILYQISDKDFPLMIRFSPPCWPNGWMDHVNSQTASFLFREVATVDPQSRRVFPKVDLELQHQVEQACARWDATAPWNYFFTLASSPLVAVTQKYALGQARVDEARMVCALERYRLAHNVYPDSLDALAPAYIDELPHDVMTGGPYHYQLRADGTFFLYSVGWNQIDDGGTVVYQKDNPKLIDYKQGDWVWPTDK
jgi:hypothetical protein